jgi:hypothetical protein
MRTLLTLGILLLFYIAGVFARYRYGIAVVIHNQSEETLRNVSVKVDYKGRHYPLSDLRPGQSNRIFVDPAGESSIKLEFTDQGNRRRWEMLAGYVEEGHCGTATALVVSPDHVNAHDNTSRLFYWKSWLEFL